ncbi:MAG: hypothetical protein PF693_14590 [Spirochaetia bacterium]|nr:hypothetical protein [Spirochaetia bacterium]
MKQTGDLKVLTDQRLSEKEIIINPNDGFDLSLMMTEADVALYFEDNPEQIFAKIIQKNECTLGTVELGQKSINKTNGNGKVRLIMTEQEGTSKLTITSV